MKQLRIGVDLDSVVYEIIYPWVDKYNKVYKDSLKYDQFDDWDFNFSKKKIKCTPENFFWFSQHADVQWEAPLIHGAVEALTQLQADGHLICFITSAKRGVIPIKVAKLTMDFPDLAAELHFTKEKWHIHTDVMIDDNPHLVKQWATMMQLPPLILFNRPHNRDTEIPIDRLNEIWRADGWRNVYKSINRRILGEEVEW